MALTDYTTYNEIRAALGVTDEEVEDVTLGLAMYESQLILHLDDIDDGLVAKFAEVSALPTPTATQTKFLKVCRLFSTYAVSKDLLSSLPLFAPKRVTDGKAEIERFVDVFADVKDGVQAGYSNMRTRLAALYAQLDTSFSAPTAITRLFAVATGLATDPVTG